MKKIKSLILIACLYASCAHSTLYSCDVLKDQKKISTLMGELAQSTPVDPNIALAFTLCQQAGLKPVNVLLSVPGIRGSSLVTKSQLLPDPACTLKCTSISSS